MAHGTWRRGPPGHTEQGDHCEPRAPLDSLGEVRRPIPNALKACRLKPAFRDNTGDTSNMAMSIGDRLQIGGSECPLCL